MSIKATQQHPYCQRKKSRTADIGQRRFEEMHSKTKQIMKMKELKAYRNIKSNISGGMYDYC